MVNLKRYIVVALPVVYLIFASHSHVDASNNFCATAVDKQLCVTTVKGATNWDEAITKALILAQNQLAKANKSGNPACKKYYKDTKENLMESLEAMGMATGSEEVKNKSLNVQLPEALASLEDCIKALKVLKEYTSAEKTLMHGIEQAIRVCVAVNESKSASKSPMSNTPSFNIIS